MRVLEDLITERATIDDVPVCPQRTTGFAPPCIPSDGRGRRILAAGLLPAGSLYVSDSKISFLDATSGEANGTTAIDMKQEKQPRCEVDGIANRIFHRVSERTIAGYQL